MRRIGHAGPLRAAVGPEKLGEPLAHNSSPVKEDQRQSGGRFNYLEVGIMWAQLITARIRADREQHLTKLCELLKTSEQPDSGLVRETIMRDQNDPRFIHVLSVFESEDKARARESDPRRQDTLAELQKLMRDMLEAPPQFRDLAVIDELTA